MGKGSVMPRETDLPDQSLVNIEAYIMGTNPPQDVAVDVAKLLLEVRRRRFEAIGTKLDLEWRRNFSLYGKHLPVCRLLLDENTDRCTCGFAELMEQVKYV